MANHKVLIMSRPSSEKDDLVDNIEDMLDDGWQFLGPVVVSEVAGFEALYTATLVRCPDDA